ncbi:MAG: hypothetical protein WAO78_15455 [Roseovarius sp.]
MPARRLIMILACVIAAAGVTLVLTGQVGPANPDAFGWQIAIPVALLAYVALRVMRRPPSDK